MLLSLLLAWTEYLHWRPLARWLCERLDRTRQAPPEAP
jgi:hypothetical protein